MSDIREDIVGWLHQGPDWLQESAQRILEKGALEEKDIEELTEYLKTEDGQKPTDHRPFTGLVRRPSESESTLHLISIGEIEGIENLSPQSSLNFGEGNLCVIYGHNGSGKSGYARILKRICGKPRADELIPNVFEEPPTQQKCNISYWNNQVETSVDWYTSHNSIEDLESVDLFDGDEATFYLNKETGVSYTPPEIALFESLAQVCDQVKGKLNEQQIQLVSKLPDIPNNYAGTRVAQTYQSLSAEKTEEDLVDILYWTEEDQEALKQIQERLGSTNPAQLADTKRRRKNQLDNQLLAPLKAAIEATDDGSIKQIQELKNEALRKRAVAVEGARAQTADAQLEGIGTDTWNALWQAAREYSTKTAYPGQEFPVTEEGSHCVLCHQELNIDAQQRLQNFEAYVQGKLEQDAQRAEQEFIRAIDALPQIPSEETLRTNCEASGLVEEKWLSKLEDEWGKIANIIGKLKDREVTDDIQGSTKPDELLRELEKISEQLQNEIDQHVTDAEEFEREKLNKDRLELEAKHWTSQQKDSILEEIKRLKEYDKYEAWKSSADSRGITMKAGEISEKVITEAYVERFNDELSAINASNLRVELVKTRTQRGQAKHKLQLQNAQIDNDVTSVLSDGERRIVSLAAFLADVTGRPEASPFIFDDPISSLDHEFEWEAAMRLANLAKDRQVIVFTHRLSLYGMMEEAAKKIGDDWKKQNFVQRCIESFAGASGHTADEQAWAQNTKTANNTLINRLDQAKKYWDSNDSANYKIYAQSICTDFRKLIERTVEEDLLNHVVKRHRRSITTDNRLDGLPKIEDSDCKFVDELMTKYSKFLHSFSLEGPVKLPDEPELRQDLEQLKKWREDFRKKLKS